MVYRSSPAATRGAMPDYGSMHGWHDEEFVERPDSSLPAYMGAATFAKLPLVTDIGPDRRTRP